MTCFSSGLMIYFIVSQFCVFPECPSQNKQSNFNKTVSFPVISTDKIFSQNHFLILSHLILYFTTNKTSFFLLFSNFKLEKPNYKTVIYNKFRQLQMEFPTNISKYLKVNPDGFIICTGKTINKLLQPNFANEGLKMLHDILNQLGANSAKAQGLKQIITTAIKFSNSDHRLYLKVEGNMAIGFLRTGEKKLFYHDSIGKMKELNPTCVLDIYVHESYQRSGIGKQIFETFLKQQNKRPQRIAYDRPSPKLFGFLKKHYGLSKFIPQNNNFVIFDQFFTSISQTIKAEQKIVEGEGFKQTANRFYKYENKPQVSVQQKPLVETKQLNKTMGTGRVSTMMGQQVPMKEEKIEDSLSLLQKEINRLHLKTPPVISSNKDVLQGKDSIKGNTIETKVSESKINAYMNYAPWATTSDPIFRTTSNQYGSHYGRKK